MSSVRTALLLALDQTLLDTILLLSRALIDLYSMIMAQLNATL